MIPLSFLPIDSCGQILELSGNAGFCKRLEEMGVRPGVEVRMLRHGSPCILAIQGRRISLRLEPTDEIWVAEETVQASGTRFPASPKQTVAHSFAFDL